MSDSVHALSSFFPSLPSVLASLPQPSSLSPRSPGDVPSTVLPPSPWVREREGERERERKREREGGGAEAMTGSLQSC